MSEKSCVQNCRCGGEISLLYFLLYVCFKILYFEVLGPLLLELLFGVLCKKHNLDRLSLLLTCCQERAVKSNKCVVAPLC